MCLPRFYSWDQWKAERLRWRRLDLCAALGVELIMSCGNCWRSASSSHMGVIMPRDARYYIGRLRRTDWLPAIGDRQNEQTTRSVYSEISSEESGDDRSSCSSRRGLYAKNQAQGILSKLDVLCMGCSCEPTICPMSLACG